MPVFLSPSQLASRQAAASLLADDDGTPYHDSRPIARLPLDGEVAVAFPPGKVVQRAANPRGVCSPLSSAAEEGLSHETGKEATCLEVPQSSRTTQSISHSGTHASNHDSRRGTRLSNGSRTHSDSPQQSGTQSSHGTRTVDQRHLERLAQPRTKPSSANRHMRPNYGRLLNFTEEEERNRQREEKRCGKSAPRSQGDITSSVEWAESTRLRTPPSFAESEHRALPATTVVPATQMPWHEKLSASKKASPAPMTDSDEPSRRTSPAALAPRRDERSTFDRLAVPNKPATNTSSNESMLSPSRQTYSDSSNTRVSTQVERVEQEDLSLQRLAKLKQRTTSSHRLSHAPTGHKPHTPKKRYYGGTTVISAPPSISSSATLPPPPPLASGRVPCASWEELASFTVRRASATAASSFPSPSCCIECGNASSAQTHTVSSQPVTIGVAAWYKDMAKGAALLLNRSSPAPASNSDGPRVVQSTPAKATSLKPPIVVRTRRYVPPPDEQDSGDVGQPVSFLASEPSSATLAPKPVEAVRRRIATPTMRAETAEITPVETVAHATTTPVADQGIEPASPPPLQPRPAEVTGRPVAVQATKRVLSSPASTESASAPRRPVVLEDTDRQLPAPCSVRVAPKSSSCKSPLQPSQGTPTRTQTCSLSCLLSSAPASDEAPFGDLPEVTAAEANDAAADTSVSATEEVYAIPPLHVGGKKGPRKILHRRPPKVKHEALQDDDFACQLEVVSPEPHPPFIIKRPTKTVAKTKALKRPLPKKR
ncbi:hypothetical protein LSCM1_04529 [Leishmania martiniquensis]|uniref:Uncharacterized protein n=1 Tax=Leishmania martiniquensis TaxID=1580590 RepID=A0A836GHQ2_9TRYP|nr:hypothetical protein LSCM1_04529 [Leishmania martiniquensis]